MLAISSTFFITACAQPQTDPRAFRSQPEEVKEYYSRFQEYYNVNPYYVSAGFVDKLDGTKVAICTSWDSGYREIRFKSSFWDGLGDYGKEQLVFHELGHCVFNLPHNNNRYSNGCPMSIMNEYAFGDTNCYSWYRDELISNLGGK